MQLIWFFKQAMIEQITPFNRFTSPAVAVPLWWQHQFTYAKTAMTSSKKKARNTTVCRENTRQYHQIQVRCATTTSERFHYSSVRLASPQRRSSRFLLFVIEQLFLQQRPANKIIIIDKQPLAHTQPKWCSFKLVNSIKQMNFMVAGERLGARARALYRTGGHTKHTSTFVFHRFCSRDLPLIKFRNNRTWYWGDWALFFVCVRRQSLESLSKHLRSFPVNYGIHLGMHTVRPAHLENAALWLMEQPEQHNECP